MTNKSRNSDSNQEFKVPPAFKFQEGEKVLCFHGPLIYEAKCLQSRYDDEEKNNKYHIHYSGWNKSWDEWVPESRVLKHNEGNIQRQKELHKAQKAEPKGKKGKKRSVTGKEKETDGKEKDPDDSRSSTPVNEKGGGGKASASATQSSSQESASDIPKRKRSKLDPSVETPEESPTDKTEPPKPSCWWKVSLAGPAKNPKKRRSETSLSRSSSPDKNVSVGKKTSTNTQMSPEKPTDQKSSEKQIHAKELSPEKLASPKNKTAATSTSHLKGKSPQKAKSSKSPSPVKKPSPKRAASPRKSASPKKQLSPSKLYPLLKGRKLSVKIDKLDLNWFDEKTGRMTPPIVDGEIDDLTMFGAYVVDQLRQISDRSKVAAMKLKIQKYLTQQNVKANK